jgi:hypothetical protein
MGCLWLGFSFMLFHGHPCGCSCGCPCGIQSTHLSGIYATTKPSLGFLGLMVIYGFLQNPSSGHIGIHASSQLCLVRVLVLLFTGIMGYSYIWIVWWTAWMLLELGISVFSAFGDWLGLVVVIFLTGGCSGSHKDTHRNTHKGAHGTT